MGRKVVLAAGQLAAVLSGGEAVFAGGRGKLDAGTGWGVAEFNEELRKLGRKLVRGAGSSRKGSGQQQGGR